ncbi:glycosyltransferase [Flavobacteriaceae bacterium MHTCC 0001]
MIEKTQNTPLVSICIPMYNVAEYIEETLRRVLEQSYENIEIIIVDDHSTDNSYRLAKKFQSEKVKLFKNERKGGNAARNFAFKLSQGTYVKFMDSDDYCSNDMIKKQLDRMLKEGTEDTLIHSPLKMFYPDSTMLAPPRTIDKDFIPGIELLVAIWKREGFNVPHCHLMHRNLVIKAGPWDEELIKNQDGEYFARVAAVADKSLAVKDVFAFWRQTNKGVSAQKSIKAHAAVLHSYDLIAQLLLKYQDTPFMRELCGKYIGFFVLENYPQVKAIFPELERILEKLRCKLALPNRKIVKLFSLCFGWKKGLIFLHKLKIIK